MARYIDADKLIKSLELSIQSWSGDCNSNAPTMVRVYQDVVYRVKNIPTADVVPKSEVEKTVEKLMSATDKVICEAKQEVAGEIFEEIEKLVITDNLEKYYGYPVIAYSELGYAELKKKYTESDNSIVGTKWEFAEKISYEQPDLSDVKFIDNKGHVINRDDALDWNEAPPLEESEGEE